jgi:hypothetical protein
MKLWGEAWVAGSSPAMESLVICKAQGEELTLHQSSNFSLQPINSDILLG